MDTGHWKIGPKDHGSREWLKKDVEVSMNPHSKLVSFI